MNTLYDLKEMAKEEVRDWAIENPESDEPHDAIHEIADSSVPVYHSQLLDLMCEDHSLAYDVPELGPAFDGESTPVNIIAANVYEAIEAACWDEWREIEDEHKD